MSDEESAALEGERDAALLDIGEESLELPAPFDISAPGDIADLTGIEHFTALDLLWCEENKLTSLDMSRNTALSSFGCAYNSFPSESAIIGLEKKQSRILLL